MDEAELDALLDNVATMTIIVEVFGALAALGQVQLDRMAGRPNDEIVSNLSNYRDFLTKASEKINERLTELSKRSERAASPDNPGAD
jgi:hypothetical protein